MARYNKRMARRTSLFVTVFFVGFSAAVSLVFAQELSSSNFKLLDPVIFPAGYATSAGFQLSVIIGQPAIGTSTSAGFGINAGFLYFPFVTTPALSTTAGDAQVALSWTAATGFLGWTVSGYSVGQSTVSGGPYTYTSVGNVLVSTRTGLTNGTTYYFVLLPEDTFGNRIATSTQASATPVAAAVPPVTPPSSGGGGGLVISGATVNFSGRAYPGSAVTILKDGQVAIKTVAGSDAGFSAALSNLSGGSYIFNVYSEDASGRRSAFVTLPIVLPANATVNISGIFLSPTIDVDKSEVRKGDVINIFGQSAINADIVIRVNSEQELFLKTKSDKAGAYLLAFDTDPLEFGRHLAQSKAVVVNEISPLSAAVGFSVGTKNVTAGPSARCPQRGDLNDDCRVNAVDFSIAAYWWERPLTETGRVTVDAKLWPDGVITPRDFSVMAFYWTG